MLDRGQAAQNGKFTGCRMLEEPGEVPAPSPAVLSVNHPVVSRSVRRLRSSVSVPCASNSIARTSPRPDPEDAGPGPDDREPEPPGPRGERMSGGATVREPLPVPTTTHASSVRSCIPSSLARTCARMTMSSCCRACAERLRRRKERAAAAGPSPVLGEGLSSRPDPGTRSYAGGFGRDGVREE